MSYHYIRLNETEKKQLAYELSKENIPPILLSLKKSFNDTYQFILNIFKKIFSSKKNNNQINNELSTFVEELEKIEMNVLKQYKIMMFYVEIMDLDINGSQISLEVENEEEKDEILRDRIPQELRWWHSDGLFHRSPPDRYSRSGVSHHESHILR